MVFSSYSIWATEPIKFKRPFVELDFVIPVYHHYKQIEFGKKGFSGGIAVSLGRRDFPVFLEYNTMRSLRFEYRNNSLTTNFRELGLRMNLNRYSSYIPNGIDPYIGVGYVTMNSTFVQKSILDEEENLIHQQFKTANYKLSAGVKFGNNAFTLGLHYDYIPSNLVIQRPEADPLAIYNTLNMVSLRAGIRLHTMSSRRVKCPRFGKHQKRTFIF